MEFEWDPLKAKANSRTHGVTFDEASSVFADPLARLFDDPDHSADERREIIAGHSSEHRLLLVFFTEHRDRVRIISAREATQRERKDL